ncbi:MAG: hypothetical protein EZS28_007264 [Streblomastix strix]|uniref:Uncharacterized protein n=1 Tax=Streblomastix strix TaxID=222440 RepID=A0A5J4WQI6_9EUKA|nr:MAG: hypothetical protein EZS28_007264 [Streblomastix strix]
MSFKSSDYLGRLAKMQHSDYVTGYLQLGEVLKSLSIHPQSFEISKQNFFDSPITELTSSGVKHTKAPFGARGKSACSMVQTCQLHKGYFGRTAKRIESSEYLQFWIGFSTAYGRFYQFQLMKDATALWGSAIYAREQAVISGNSLSDLCTKNSINVSPLESIIEGKHHYGVFIDIPLCEIDRQATAATPFYYRIPFDITFSGVLDLYQLNPIFNSFPVLTRNYATLHLQLCIQDLLQDLKVVWLNKNDTILNNHLAHHMTPPEKPDIVYLLSGDDAEDLSGFDKTRGSMLSIMSFSNIKSLFMTFAMQQYPTWFFPVLFTGLNLVSDQNNVIPQPYKSLNQAIDEQMFDCFVDQDVVSAPSDLYHSPTFENLNIDDKKNYYGLIDNADQYKTANIFYLTTLCSGNKAIRTLYLNKYMLAWKLATDDSLIHRFNSSKLGSRTNIQMILQGNLTKGIIETTNVGPSQNQNDFKQFIGTRAYPDPTKVSITPMMHYLCDAFVRIIFDDSSMPNVLNIDVIGELAGGAIKPQLMQKQIYFSPTYL